MRNWTNGIIDRSAVDVGRTRNRCLESQFGKDKAPDRCRAKLFASPAELVDDCEVVVVMLLNDAATEAVYRDRTAS